MTRRFRMGARPGRGKAGLAGKRATTMPHPQLWVALLLTACLGLPGEVGLEGAEDAATRGLDSGDEVGPERDAGLAGHADASEAGYDAATGADAASSQDASRADASSRRDASHPDASSLPDASQADASQADASSIPDASHPDASHPDASENDAGPVVIPSSHSPGDPRDPYHKHGGSACIDCHGNKLQGASGPSCYTCHNSSDHTLSRNNVMHRDANSSTCADCHGPNDTGGLGPACSTCHS